MAEATGGRALSGRPARVRSRPALAGRLRGLVRLPPELLLGRLLFALKRPLFRLPLYRATLAGRVPAQLAVTPSDPWPGQAALGTGIVQGRFTLAGRTLEQPAPLWAPLGADPAWCAELHGFDWLRDLRAAGGDAPRRRARELAAAWIEANPGCGGPAWAPAVTGRRLAAWLGQYEFFGASADHAFKTRLLDSAARQARHLARVLPAGLAGADLMAAVKGLVYAGVCLPGGETWLRRGLALLEAEVPRQVLADGGHAERSPSLHLAVLRDLIDLRAVLHAGGHEPPASLQLAIQGMTPFLKMLQHGDGGLALFNDSWEEEAVVADVTLQRGDGRGRPQASAPESGFQRLQAGRTLVLVDAGAPPPAAFDGHAHAGTLSFEMSHGRERLIVNCGAHPGDPRWRRAQRATAAHSTLSLGEANSSELLPETGLGRRPRAVMCRREEGEGAIWLDTSHDGYEGPFGATHLRRLYLAAGGEDLRGEDRIKGTRPGVPFTIRFHLQPEVRAGLVQDGAAALLRLPGGTGWRLRAAGAAIALEDSVYLGRREGVRRTLQVVLSGETAGGETVIKWALKREGGRRS